MIHGRTKIASKQPAPRRQSNRPSSNEAPTQDENPGSAPGDGLPTYSPNQQRTLRTQMSTDGQDSNQRDRLTSPSIELASIAPKSGTELSPYQPNIPSLPNGLSVPRDAIDGRRSKQYARDQSLSVDAPQAS